MGHARSGAHSPDCRAGACAHALAGGGAIGRVLSAQALKSTAPSRWWLSCVPHEHTTGKPKRACPIHGKWRPSLSRRPRRRAFLNLLLSSKPLVDYFHSEQSGSVLLPSLILPLVPPAFRPKITIIQGRGVTLTSMTPLSCAFERRAVSRSNGAGNIVCFASSI